MKKSKAVSLGIVILLTLAVSMGCAAKGESPGESATPGPEASPNGSAAPDFSFSEGLDDNGLWAGVKALDFVELCAYKGISVPGDVHAITDDSVQSEVDSILSDYATEEHITDRAIADGDTVNIDYVGTVDGVAFEGGDTQGQGTDVTIGVTQYIDDFLEQLVGHTPGESFDVNVTFPADYGVEDLNGKDAVFAVTVNYIVNTIPADLTDGFVAENLSESYGWNTVDEMKSGIKSDLQGSAVMDYVQDYVITNTTVQSVPEDMITYQEQSMLSYYQDYADYNEMELDEFLSSYMGVASADELFTQYKDDNTKNATFDLVFQAIAEDAGINVTDDDVAAYFSENMGSEDYSTYQETYGLPYLKMIVLQDAVTKYITDNAVME